MPTYQISAPDGNTYRIEGPSGATDEQVRAEVLRQHPQAGTPKAQTAEPEPKATTGSTLRHGFLRSALPTAAGFAAGSASGALAVPLGPIGIGAAALGGGMAASTAVEVAQEAFLKAHPHIAEFLGLDEKTAEAEEKAHPYISMAAQAAPSLLALRPSTAAFKSLRNATTREAANAITAARVNSALGTGLGVGIEAGQQAMGDQPMDWTKVGLSGAIGSLGQKETKWLGERLSGLGESMAGKGAQAAIRAIRRPGTEEATSTGQTAAVSPEVESVIKGAEPGKPGKQPREKGVREPVPLTDTHQKVLDIIQSGQDDTWAKQRERIRKEIDPNLDDQSIVPIISDLRRNGLISPHDFKKGRWTTPEQGTPSAQTKPTSGGTNAEAVGESPVVPVSSEAAEGESSQEPPTNTLDSDSGLPTGANANEESVNPALGGENPPVGEGNKPSIFDVFKDKEEVETGQEPPPASGKKSRKPKVTKDDQRQEFLNRVNELKQLNVRDDRLDELSHLTDTIHDANTPEEFKQVSKELERHEEAAKNPDYYHPPEPPAEPVEPTSLHEHLEKGDINGAMESLAKPIGEGETRNPVVQALADLIHSDESLKLGQQERGTYGNLKINLEGTEGYDARAIERLRKKGIPSSYDPKTNTLHFTREGLTEVNFIHEIAHAFTVRELKNYNPLKAVMELKKFRDKAVALEAEEANIRADKTLSQEKRDGLLAANKSKQNSNSTLEDKLLRRSTAVEKIHNIFNDSALDKLRSKYPEAFRNIYEFVGHSMTYPEFQRELAQLRIPDPAYTYNSQTGISAKQSGMMGRRTEKTINALKDTNEDLKYDWQKAKTQEEKENLAQEMATNSAEIDRLQKQLDKSEGKKDTVWNQLTEAIKNFFGISPRGAHGNVLLELSEAFKDILKPPEAKGLQGVGELYARRKPGEVKVVPPQPTFASDEAAFNHAVKGKEEQAATDLANQQKKKPFYERYLDIVVTLQNDRRYLKEYEQALSDAGKLGFDENNNAIYTSIVHSAGIAQDLNTQYIAPYTTKMNDAIQGYARARGLTLHEALARLDIMYTAMHEHERRAVNYLKNAPLDNSPGKKFSKTYYDKDGKAYTHNDTAAGHRKHILDEVKKPDDMTRKVVNGKSPVEMYRDALVDIVKNHTVPDGESPLREYRRITKAMPTDINDPLYSVIGGYTKQQMDTARAKFATEMQDPKTAAHLKALTDNLKAVQKNTQMLAIRANYWTQPVTNLTALYGYEHYVPFKGLPISTDALHVRADEDLDPGRSRKLGGGYAIYQEEAKGRQSISNNVLLQAMADGTASAMQAGRKDVADAIANLSNTYKSFGKRIDKIPFDKREEMGEKLAKKGANTFFRYMPDGQIEIYELKDPRLSNAIRRVYTDQSDVMSKTLGGIGKVTQTIAIGHTRLNPAFAPYNFMRHTLTDFTAIIPEMGFRKGAQFMQRLTSRVWDGGLATTLKTVSLYEKGDFVALEKLAKDDPFVRDTLEFIQQGGRTSWVQGLTNKAQYDQLLQQIKLQGGVAKTFDQITKMTDHYGDMFELTVRTAVYQTAKEFQTEKAVKEFVKSNNRQPTDAERKAIATSSRVKQLASSFTKEMENYEHSGTVGKQLGSLYAFWRANATGAVRAMDALMPAFMSEKAFLRQLPPELNHETQIKLARDEIVSKHNREPTAEEMATIQQSEKVLEAKKASDKLTARFKERQGMSRLLLGAMIGAGMAAYNMSYLMAPKDKDGRNEVEYDNKDMWVRSWRLPIGKDTLGKDNDFLQIPWGFGGGALAGIGAQIMSAIYGHSNLKELAGNTTLLVRDSYFPIPAAEFNPKDDPLAWAVDSVLPSALRPFVEYKMNKDTFGRQVHTGNMSKYGGAYTGGDYIPQIYQDTSRFLAKISNGGILWDPNTIHFFASNFSDGYARVGQMVWDTAYGLKGDKMIDPKVALLPFGNYIGKHTSFDAKKYSEAQKDVEGMKEALEQFSTRPDLYRNYVKEHPNAPLLVESFNKINGGPLKRIREAINIYQSSDRPPKEYADQVRQLKEMRDMIMRRYTDMYDQYGED